MTAKINDLLIQSLNAISNQYQIVKKIKFCRLLVEKSLLSKQKATLTKILPNPTTQFETIYTCMKNFQDILKQCELPYGPLWSDQGVYRTAKKALRN